MWPPWVKWVIGITAGLLLSVSGISIAHIPTREISYVAEKIPAVCTTEGGCIGIYKVSVGNTGRLMEEFVDVVLARKALQESILPLKVLNSGVVARPHLLSESDSEVRITLSELESGKRVDITFVLKATHPSDLPDPAKLLHRVESSSGVIVQGNPEMLRFGRFLYAFLKL